MDSDKRSAALEKAQEHVVTAFKLTQEALRDALKKRSDIEKQILELQKDLIKFALFYDVEVQDPLAQMGLTDAIRYVISRTDEGIKTNELQETLVDARVRLPDSNPRAAIQTTLKRLVASEEINERKPSLWVWMSKRNPPTPPIPDWMVEDIDKWQ